MNSRGFHASSGHAGRVLLVDDDEVTRYAVAHVLRRAGAQVVEVASLPQATDAIDDDVDVLLLAAQRVTASDIAARRVLRQHAVERRVPVVHLTARATGDDEAAVQADEEADGCLAHPVRPDALVSTVRAFVRASRAERALGHERLPGIDGVPVLPAMPGARATRATLDAEEREWLLTRERMAREDAERANQSKDVFLAVLSHELRTPLNVIVGWSQVLKAMAADLPHLQRAIDAIERNAEVQTRLIADLLDVSRITTGKLTLDRQPIAPGEAIDAALASLADTARERDVTIVRDDGDGLGCVRWDRSRLAQVVWNLVGNAIKFSPPGAVVRVTLRREGDAVVLDVQDAGRGIAPGFLPHLFTQFAQEQPSGNAPGGLGLGLAVVKHLVEAHGDRVEASSAGRGLGATFRVIFSASSSR